MTPTFRLAALSALLLACAFPARADWTGTLKIHVDPPDPRSGGDQQGSISGKGTKMRFDLEQAQMGKMGVIMDMKEHKSIMIMEARHAFTVLDMDKAQGRGGPMGGVHCDTDDAVVCLKKAGFTKTGSEVANGKKADRWEHDRDDARGEKVHESLWVPVGVKGFALVRQVTKAGEHTITLDVLDFQETSLPDAQFDAPAGYTDMTNHMGPPGGAGMPARQPSGQMPMPDSQTPPPSGN